MDPESGKPICGSEEQTGEYDLALHVVGLFLVLGASIFGAGFPVVAKKVPWVKIPSSIFFACKHFGTGVLVATAFVHLLPTAFGNLTDPCLPDLFTTDYPPMPGVIMMAALFALFIIEMMLNHKMGGQGHSHGGPMGLESGPAPAPAMTRNAPPRPPRLNRGSFDSDDVDEEKKMAQKMFEEHARAYEERVLAEHPEMPPQSEMPAWFVVFYEQYVRQRLEMLNLIKVGSPRQLEYGQDQQRKQATVTVAEDSWLDEEGQVVDPLVYKKLSLNITLLEGGILFHSVFVGMTISITIEGFVILLIAILFHQLFEGLGLGSRIAAVPYPKGSIRPWVLVVAFGTTAPIGQAIGLIARNSYDPNSAFGLIIVGVFNAISAGLLIYAATVDLLAEDFLSEEANQVLTKKDKIVAFCYVLAGAAGMSIVGAFA